MTLDGTWWFVNAEVSDGSHEAPDLLKGAASSRLPELDQTTTLDGRQ
jgi:hypothetical protein